MPRRPCPQGVPGVYRRRERELHGDGREKQTFLLNHPYQGLLVETGVWRTLDDFSSGAVCLVMASEPFEEEDYIRDYGDYLEYLRGR